MRLAASLVLYLAALVCAREWAETTDPGSPQLDEDEEVTSTMEENSVEGYSITCYDRTRIPACDVIEEVTIIDAVASQTTGIEYDLTIVDGDELVESPQTMVCNLDSNKPAICTVTEINESLSYSGVKSESLEEEYDTATAETTSEIFDLETTLSCSSSSLAVSTHAMSPTTSGSVRSTSSVGPGVGSMSITNTQIRVSSASPTSSSAHSTGAAPIATGEVAMMIGGAAMALLVAVL
ncbi:hypothetical protein AbraIFM66951_007942 [Aspergillus brasiliensis]|uniref:Uncharacterized protein n=1 Tax=Aspergillus brasiliensis TaxID=319629 RepID=A0A9W6DM40_9EURO|nr:hypothetical protein AbraCBS73388_008448 [Aspergillus brasiliensis]GKZ45325.1 hypothetical protein AbraIFM66951_007942 [Aspergillus brasiliensis]